ncbi:hypothetical protein D3C71_1629810 [compost metagenome]
MLRVVQCRLQAAQLFLQFPGNPLLEPAQLAAAVGRAKVRGEVVQLGEELLEFWAPDYLGISGADGSLPGTGLLGRALARQFIGQNLKIAQRAGQLQELRRGLIERLHVVQLANGPEQAFQAPGIDPQIVQPLVVGARLHAGVRLMEGHVQA